MQLLVLSALLAVAAASGVKTGYGYAAGKCSRDGFFYHSERSFTICSNGNAYVQPCAPGTRNSGRYKAGGYGPSAHAFCDINLVDHGYSVKHGGYGYGSYGRGSRGYGGYGGYAGNYARGGRGYTGGYGYNGYAGGYGGYGGYGSYGGYGGYSGYGGYGGYGYGNAGYGGYGYNGFKGGRALGY